MQLYLALLETQHKAQLRRSPRYIPANDIDEAKKEASIKEAEYNKIHPIKCVVHSVAVYENY